MSFISEKKGRVSAQFLESQIGVVPKTRQMEQSGATVVGDDKYVLGGTIYPANDGTAEGIVFEDVCVTSGDMPGSVIVAGRVYTDRLLQTPSAEAKAALEAGGIVFIPTAPAVTRPY